MTAQPSKIDVATVLGDLAAGEKIEDIEENYRLTRDQIMAALAYATHVAQHLPPAVKSACTAVLARPSAHDRISR